MTDKATGWQNRWMQHTRRATPERHRFLLRRAALSVKWQGIRSLVLDRFGSFDGLKVIELGAGKGTDSALMAQEGAEVTLLDQSANALNYARDFFATHGLEASFVIGDALQIAPELESRYDVSMSHGVADYFTGQERRRILASHFQVLNQHGVSFISVTNRFSLVHVTPAFLAHYVGLWRTPAPRPFTREELSNTVASLGHRQIACLHGSFLGDLYKFYLSHVPGVYSLLGRAFSRTDYDVQLAAAKLMYRPSFLDRFAVALVLAAEN